MADRMRISGMASGIDVDEAVKQMLSTQRARIDKLKQNRQIIQWRQESYRDIINDLKSFRNTYLDLLSPADTNMLSANNYAGYDVKYGTNNSMVSITPSVGTACGSYNVSYVKTGSPDGHMAKSAGVTADLGAGTTKYSKVSDVANIKAGTIKINYANGANSTFGEGGNPSTPIEIQINDADTINDIINRISSASSNNLKATYSELTHNFTIETTNTGANSKIEIAYNQVSDVDTTASISTLPLQTANGEDALVYITPPGSSEAVAVTRSSNTFLIDGVIYNLSSEKNLDGTNSSSINITPNPSKTFEKIKGFIDKYNEFVEKINKKIDEKKQYSYKPLTDEQREAMKEDDIKLWEEKAKRGLLKNDSNLSNMLNSIRRSFFDEVKNAGISLSDVGLNTSEDTTQRGKIILEKDIDGQFKLEKALKNNPEKVADLFRKDSEIKYDPDHKNDSGRYDNIGVFRRIDDILKDYIRTGRDSAGKKGILIETAGTTGDLSEINNLLSQDIRDNYDNRIKDMENQLLIKQEQYYRKFSQLEVAMQKLNSQTSWLAQQLGSIGGGK